MAGKTLVYRFEALLTVLICIWSSSPGVTTRPPPPIPLVNQVRKTQTLSEQYLFLYKKFTHKTPKLHPVSKPPHMRLLALAATGMKPFPTHLCY